MTSLAGRPPAIGPDEPDRTPLSLAMPRTVHATCMVAGEVGILIRGPSGSGKSSLALSVIDRAARDGHFSALVGDDRVRLASFAGRLVARPHPVLAGKVEIRGHGIVVVDAVEACVLRLVVDLVDAVPRLPETPVPDAMLLGVGLPCITIDRAVRDAGSAARIVLAAAGVSSQPHTRP